MKTSMTESNSWPVFDCCNCISGHITDPQYKAAVVGFCTTTLWVSSGPVMVCKNVYHICMCMYVWRDKRGGGRFLSPTHQTRCGVSLSPDGQISHTLSSPTVIRSYGILPSVYSEPLATLSFSGLMGSGAWDRVNRTAAQSCDSLKLKLWFVIQGPICL